MPTSQRLLPLLLLLASFVFGCKESPVGTSNTNPGISISPSGLYPSRTGETYAIWFEVPISSVSAKGNVILHGSSVQKFAGTFRIDQSGNMVDLDTTDLLKRIGTSLSLALRGIISVEKIGAIDSLPASELMGGDITGSTTTGSVSLTTSDEDGLDNDFSSLKGAITLAYAAGKPATDLELYLMRASSPTLTSAGIDNLPEPPEGWQYALWVVDSASKSLPPFSIFYGTFTGAIGKDSQADDNSFDFPGGRYPADPTQPIYDLRSGKISVMVTLEPNSGGVLPPVPFGATIFQTTIATTAQAFSPIDLTNRASSFPKATITIHR
ncbi:MAG: hypothetical protein ABI778_09240 [Ignavibacteriota bacterium]